MPIGDINFNPNLKVLNNAFSRGGTSLFIELLDSADFGEWSEYVKGRRCVLPRSRACTFPIDKGHLINASL